MNHACHESQLRHVHTLTLSLFTQLKLSNTITQQAAISKPHHKSTETLANKDSNRLTSQVEPLTSGPYIYRAILLRGQGISEVFLNSLTKNIKKEKIKYRQTVRQSLSQGYHHNITI